eukprot:3225626-Rhodomonas_salina.1
MLRMTVGMERRMQTMGGIRVMQSMIEKRSSEVVRQLGPGKRKRLRLRTDPSSHTVSTSSGQSTP